MKTIEDAAKELYPQNKPTMYTQFLAGSEQLAFKAGVEFANRWISVEEEMPPKEEIDFLEDFSIDILLKNEDIIVTGYYDFEDKKFTIYGNGYENENFTHWRPIEIK